MILFTFNYFLNLLLLLIIFKRTLKKINTVKKDLSNNKRTYIQHKYLIRRVCGGISSHLNYSFPHSSNDINRKWNSQEWFYGRPYPYVTGPRFQLVKRLCLDCWPVGMTTGSVALRDDVMSGDDVRWTSCFCYCCSCLLKLKWYVVFVFGVGSSLLSLIVEEILTTSLFRFVASFCRRDVYIRGKSLEGRNNVIK